jgi:hypothetical protein
MIYEIGAFLLWTIWATGVSLIAWWVIFAKWTPWRIGK